MWGYSTELNLPLSFLQGCAKLVAMLAEIVVMLMAHGIEQSSLSIGRHEDSSVEPGGSS
jgi:hypothetical protein